MVEITCGHKRRRSDAEENERIALRQMVFNMSICKLNKDIGRKEPSLFRSVIITNTVRNIENEMDEEMFIKYDTDDTSYSNHYDQIQQNITQDIINNNINTIEIEIFDTKKLVIDPKHKFGAIGDRRKNSDEECCKDTFGKSVSSECLWDNSSLSSFGISSPTIENVKSEEKFEDVDIELYDFDYSSKPVLSLTDRRVYPTSCATEYENHKPDAFFEELDQIMQVLVGM